ncbi:hypothetical protein JKP88DRAFT_272908 [Tribonema minus]|uniref:SET domain-containing protein n=1 Tax=Tribonema minus TaxID=303371 RepID=A0A835YZN5_9STRA|nr:hypothetical protein JKP88DRAFT_272908 [Tribonema minus]
MEQASEAQRDDDSLEDIYAWVRRGDMDMWDRSSKLFEVHESPLGGLGVFAKRDVGFGEMLFLPAHVSSTASDNGYTLKGYYVFEGDINDPAVEDVCVPAECFFDGTPATAHGDDASSRDFAALVNEGGQPNCIFLQNQSLTKQAVDAAFEDGTPVIAAILVTVDLIPRGTELLTYYGDHLIRSDNGYSVSEEITEHLELYLKKLDYALGRVELLMDYAETSEESDESIGDEESE